MDSTKMLYEASVKFSNIENERQELLKKLNDLVIDGVKVKTEIDTIIKLSGKTEDEWQPILDAYDKELNKKNVAPVENKTKKVKK